MIEYRYTALTNENTIISGEEYAEDISQLKKILDQNSLTFIDCKKKSTLRSATSFFKIIFFKVIRIRKSTYREFIQAITLLLDAGISLSPAMELIISSTSSFLLKKILINIKKKVDNGHEISEAFSGYPFIFNKIFIARLNASRMNVHIKEIFSSIEKETTKQHFFFLELIIKIIPHIAFIAFTVLLWILFYNTLLAEFKWAYNYTQKKIPEILQLTITITSYIATNWTEYISIIIISIILLRLLYLLKPIRFIIDFIFAHIPGTSSLTYNNDFSRFYSTLNMSLNSKLHLLPAFNIAKKSLTNLYYIKKANLIYKELEAGRSLLDSIKMHTLFKKLEIRIIGVAENTNLNYIIKNIAKKIQFKSDSSKSIAIEIIRFGLLTIAIILLFTLIEVIDQALIPLVPILA